MDYVRVCAIDVGSRNFAYCVVDNTNYLTPLVWKREDLWEPIKAQSKHVKPTKDEAVQMAHNWCRLNQGMLDACDLIVLENQLRDCFIIMNTVVHALFYHKVRVLHPMTVGAYFGLPKTRELKKARAVDLVSQVATFDPRETKKDDLADAWLMAVYGLIDKKGIARESVLQNKKLKH